MKKSVLILTLILQCAFVYSQTKDDILEWIVTQVKTHPLTDPEIYYEHDFTVKDDKVLIIKIALKYFDTKNPYHKPFYETSFVDIKDINNIIFKYNETNTWMIIYTRNKHRKELQTGKGNIETVYSNEVNIILDPSINKEDLPKRLKKAWSDYIELFGGEIKTDLY